MKLWADFKVPKVYNIAISYNRGSCVLTPLALVPQTSCIYIYQVQYACLCYNIYNATLNAIKRLRSIVTTSYLSVYLRILLLDTTYTISAVASMYGFR